MICIINCGSSFINEIKKSLDELGYSYKIVDMNKIKDYKFDSFSGIIISGSPILLTKVDAVKYLKLFDFIKNLDIPVLGICFGHQITGLVYGSKIDKLVHSPQKSLINF